MANTDITRQMISLIKSERTQVANFVIRHGGALKKNDSDVKAWKELSKILNKSELAKSDFKKEFSKTDNFMVLDLVSQVFGNQNQSQQNQDQITLALINAGVQKSSSSNTVIYVSLILLALLIFGIGFLLYKKYNKS
jgi:hypothetical protein